MLKPVNGNIIVKLQKHEPITQSGIHLSVKHDMVYEIGTVESDTLDFPKGTSVLVKPAQGWIISDSDLLIVHHSHVLAYETEDTKTGM